MTLILIGGTVGVVLGLRYKVFVLIPAMCVALAILFSMPLHMELG
jgi:hypothetical protein